jgi:hypothetical protein
MEKSEREIVTILARQQLPPRVAPTQVDEHQFVEKNGSIEYRKKGSDVAPRSQAPLSIGNVKSFEQPVKKSASSSSSSSSSRETLKSGLHHLSQSVLATGTKSTGRDMGTSTSISDMFCMPQPNRTHETALLSSASLAEFDYQNTAVTGASYASYQQASSSSQRESKQLLATLLGDPYAPVRVKEVMPQANTSGPSKMELKYLEHLPKLEADYGTEDIMKAYRRELDM